MSTTQTINPTQKPNGSLAEALNQALPTDPMAEMRREMERLRAENAAMKSAVLHASTLGIKTSEKGAVSVYGLGRFPVTLYWEQWERLIAFGEKIKAYIAANKASLATKER